MEGICAAAAAASEAGAPWFFNPCLVAYEWDRWLWGVFLTSQPVLSIAGSGTTAYEAARASLTKPGSKALSVAGGKFGERWQDVFDSYSQYMGLEQIKIDVPDRKSVV